MMKRVLISVAAGALLAGCVSVLPEPSEAPVVYRLSQNVQAVEPLAGAKVIRVDRPASSLSLDTKDIVVTPDGQRMAAASMASWADPIPVMVQESLVTRMAGSRNVIGLIPASGARTQTRIHLTIKNFEAKFDQGEDAPPLALVRYDVSLADASDRKLLGTYSTEQNVRAGAVQVSAIVRAMGQANDKAMDDITRWLEGESTNLRG